MERRLAKATCPHMVGAVMLMATLFAASSAVADTLILQGSTTFTRRIMDHHKASIEAEAGHELTVIPNKSMPGMIALMEGRAHMAMISSPLQSEVQALQKVLPGLPYERLKTHEVVRTRVAMVVHPSNRVRKSSSQQVRKVLVGEITNWKVLGGSNRTIRVVLVGGGGGVTTLVETELLSGRPIRGPHVIFVRTPVQLVQVVEQEQGAIGFAQLALAQQRDLPELVTERPIEQTLSYITLGEPTPAMKAVIDATRRAAESSM